MKIARYGIVLDRLKQNKIELLRKWRNAPQIKDYMEFQEHITPEMQLDWFKRINNIHNHYFLIEYQGLDIGMIHCSNINWDEKTGDSGLFIHDERYFSTPIPVFASLTLLDFFFFMFDLEIIFAKVKSDNERAVSYNKNLGFSPISGEEGKTFQTYRLTRKEYLSQTSHLRHFAQRSNGDETELIFETVQEPMDRKLWKIVENASPEAREELKLQVSAG